MKRFLIILLALTLLPIAASINAQTDESGAIAFGGVRYVDQHTRLSIGLADNPKGGKFWLMTYANLQFSDSAQAAQLQSFEVKGSYMLTAGDFFGGPIVGADLESQEDPSRLKLMSYFVVSPGVIAGYNVADWGGLWTYVERNIALESNQFVNRTDFGAGLFFNF